MRAITNAGARAVLGWCGARVVRCSGWKARATERDLRRSQVSRARKCLGGRLDAATSLPALSDSLRGFAWLPTARKVPLPHNGSTTDLRLKPERPHSCPFVFYTPPLIRVHSWFKITPAFPSRLRVRPTVRKPPTGSGKFPAASHAALISGWKARATFIRDHSCPFVSIRGSNLTPSFPSRLRVRPTATPRTRGLPSAARPPTTEH